MASVAATPSAAAIATGLALLPTFFPSVARGEGAAAIEAALHFAPGLSYFGGVGAELNPAAAQVAAQASIVVALTPPAAPGLGLFPATCHLWTLGWGGVAPSQKYQGAPKGSAPRRWYPCPPESLARSVSPYPLLL